MLVDSVSQLFLVVMLCWIQTPEYYRLRSFLSCVFSV